MSELTPVQEAEVRLAAMTAAAAFRTRGWTWADKADRPQGVPDVDAIEKTLLRLLRDLRDGWGKGGGSIATGRLYVGRGEDGEAYLSMDLGEVADFFPVEGEATP